MSADLNPYTSYEGFLRTAIKQHWESKGASRVTFLALLLATREAWAVAWDKGTDPEAGKKVLTGAAGVAAVGVLLRVFVGGPIGILLTGASVASLIAVYTKNHRSILAKVGNIRHVVRDYQVKYDDVAKQINAGDFDTSQRELMIDGLMGRFLLEIEKEPAVEEKVEENKSRSFGDHVKAKQEDEK